MKLSKQKLKQIIKEELGEARLPAWERPGYEPESEYQGFQLGSGPSDISTEDTLRSSVMDAVDLLKQGNVEDALGQLQAVLDATTGGQGLDK